jgi:hypothetical protein
LIEDEEIRLITNAVAPSQPGASTYNGTAFQMRDAAGIFDPRGPSPAEHAAYDQLVHNIAETAYTEVIRTSGRVTSVIIWTSPAKVLRIRDTAITRSGGQVDTIVVRQYDGAGAVVQTRTGTVGRLSGQVSDIDWVLS